MLVSARLNFVARKTIKTKLGQDCPLAHFSDGSDVMDCIDGNLLTLKVVPGALCDCEFDLATNKVLRLTSITQISAEV